jgi:2'-5' RNA ligase
MADSLFFALQPDAAAAARIHALAQRVRDTLELKGKLLSVDRLHVTLHFLGQFPMWLPELPDIAARAAQAVRCAPFELCFERMTTFDSPQRRRQRRPLPTVLLRDDCEALRSLRTQLAIAVAKTGCFPRAEQSTTPHVTLLYDRRSLEEEQQVERICWTAREFVLVHSLVGKSEHRVLARHPLH